MKKLILGSAMFISGVISAALLLAGSMANDWTINGMLSGIWNISQYGLLPAFYVFILIASVGLMLAVWGLFDKKDV